jgi:hypothetical protein
LSSAKGISSSSLPKQEEEQQQQFSYHQCTKCGMIYRCEKDSCQMPFLYDTCHMCVRKDLFILILGSIDKKSNMQLSDFS